MHAANLGFLSRSLRIPGVGLEVVSAKEGETTVFEGLRALFISNVYTYQIRNHFYRKF